MPLLLDSTVLIDFLRGRPAVQRVRRLEAGGEELLACAINVEEVVRGLRPEEHGAARSLFDGLKVIAIGFEVAWQAGTWRSSFAAMGTTLSQADCLIAAAAKVSSGRLATGNPSHFPMDEIQVEHWPVGV